MTPQELTEIRTTLNLTKSDLAKMLGITPMLVGKYEKGSVPIPEKIIKSVEELMGAVQETATTAEEMATPIEEASLPTGAVNTPEADEEKATPVVEESDIIVSAPADAEVTVAKKTKMCSNMSSCCGDK